MKTSFYLWKALARLCDGYGSFLGRRNLRKFGVPDRKHQKDTRLAFSRELYPAFYLKNPAAFYDIFRRGKIRLAKTTPWYFFKDVVAEKILFKSSFSSGMERNDWVHAVLYRKSPRRFSRPVIIWVGGVFTSFNGFDHWAAKKLLSDDFDVCVLALPYHGPRACYGRPGIGFLVSDPLATLEAFIQSVLDLNRLYEILQEDSGYKKVYAVGYSVGGNIVCVSSCINKYRAVVPFFTGASLADMVWFSPNPYVQGVCNLMEGKRGSLEKLCKFWIMTDVTKFKTGVLVDKCLVVGGLFDEYAGLSNIKKLYEFLGAKDLVIYPGSHSEAVFFAPPVLKNAIRFFRGQPVLLTPWKI